MEVLDRIRHEIGAGGAKSVCGEEGEGSLCTAVTERATARTRRKGFAPIFFSPGGGTRGRSLQASIIHHL